MNNQIIRSPNGRICLEFKVQDLSGKRDCFSYRVSFDERVLVDWSNFAFILKDMPDLEQGFEIISIEQSENDNYWMPVWGEKNRIRDHYKECIARLGEKGNLKRIVDIAFRIYDSGVAFCYTFQRCSGFEGVQIQKELTRFAFLKDHKVYATYQAQGTYEKVKISEMKPGCERPLVVEIEEGGPYVALAEAKLVDYARMKFAREKEYTICSELTGKPLYFFLEEEALKGLDEEHMIKVTGSNPLITPWRVIMIADSAPKLYEQNDIILNLNDPCAITDTSFIKPGKVIREITLTTEGGMACVDFAVKRNLQYVEFDAGWYGNEYDFASDATFISIDPNRYKGPLDLEKVIKYAKEKGIGIILYINHRAMLKQLDELLPLYKKWGVDGIKFGFVEVGTQRWTSWLHECIRKAASYGFVLTIHDEYRPTGYHRTYPNLLTQEGIRGDEEKQPAENTLTIVFTRMLAGPADNTVCYFDRRVNEYWSHAYQLAKPVVLFSPLQFLYWYDRPIGSFNTPALSQCEELVRLKDYDALYNIITDEPELEFFDHLPVTWDETRVLNGEIGKYVAMARRKGEEWFVGIMNAGETRSFTIPMSFLEPGKEYSAYVYSDDETVNSRTNVIIESFPITCEKMLQYEIGPNRGLAMRILPAADAV